LLTVLSACTPAAIGGANKPVLPEPPRTVPYERASSAEAQVDADGCRLAVPAPSSADFAGRALELTGDPDFKPEQLASEVRCWYEELWSVLLDPDRSAYYTSRANRYDLYTYAREMNTHINALLTALRV